MTLSEKVAYLKGLETGLNLNSERPETKMFNAIIDILQDVAGSAEGLSSDMEEMQNQVDSIDVDLSDLEDLLVGDLQEDDFDDDPLDDDGDDTDVEDDDDADLYEYVPDEDEMYEVKCPSCGESIFVDEGVLDEGSMECPNCGEKLEFDIEIEEDEEETPDEAEKSSEADRQKAD